jgi:hypothetical protein
MAAFIKFDGIDGETHGTQQPSPSWGLDRIDQRELPTQDPFLAYGEGADADPAAGSSFGMKRLQIMYILDEPEPVGDLAVETPGVEAIGLRYHAEFIYG